jgi:hypothetical protein
MKKTLAITAALLFGLTGCTNNSGNNEPTQTPTASPAVSETTAIPDPTTQPTKDEPTPDKTTSTQKPEPSPTSSSADSGTPATEFAGRWGKRYPDVPEFAILKAANGVCTFIDQYGNGWESNPLAQAGIKEVAEFAGLAGNDALEFAQDANQNYCASRANPT